MSDGDDLVRVERQLDRMQAFYPRVDAKSSALLALTTALVGTLAAVLPLPDLAFWWVGAPVGLFVLCALAAYWLLFDCARPHTDGGGGSLFYFRSIAHRTEHDFIRDFEGATPDALRRDALAQVWRNAEILTAKFEALRRATYVVVLGAVFWSLSLVAIIVLNGKMPFGHA